MKTKKTILIIVLLVMLVTACQPALTPLPTSNSQVTNIIENELVTKEIPQFKLFNLCESSSMLRTQVEFSNSDTRTDQDQLILGAEITGGGEISGAVKLEIKGSIEQHFSKTISVGQAHGESVSIEVPAYTQQEYTIIWRETRRTGTVEYVENGATKSIPYSYRVGLELASTSGKDIPCPEVVSQLTTPSPSSTPSSELLLSPSVQVIDFHFRSINDATDKESLIQAWNLMTTNLQCNPSDKCQFSIFRDWWWQWHVQYKIYDCSPYEVVVRYSLAPRNQPSSTSNTIYYEHYVLVEESGELKMNEGSLIDSLDSSCVSVIESE